MVLAMHALRHAVLPPVAHARELNPYVSAAFSDWAASSHLRSIVSRVRAQLCSAAICFACMMHIIVQMC